MNHWFDGLAMLHRFAIDDGSVSYANRFLETPRLPRREGDGRDRLLRVRDRSLPLAVPARAVAMFSPKLSDNANVNLTKLGERFIAMTETPMPVQFDAETLAAAGVAYEVPGHADDRASAPRPRQRRDAQLRGQARAAQRVPLLPPRARTPPSPR